MPAPMPARLPLIGELGLGQLDLLAGQAARLLGELLDQLGASSVVLLGWPCQACPAGSGALPVRASTRSRTCGLAAAAAAAARSSRTSRRPRRLRRFCFSGPSLMAMAAANASRTPAANRWRSVGSLIAFLVLFALPARAFAPRRFADARGEVLLHVRVVEELFDVGLDGFQRRHRRGLLQVGTAPCAAQAVAATNGRASETRRSSLPAPWAIPSPCSARSRRSTRTASRASPPPCPTCGRPSPAFNAERTLALARRASEADAALVVVPRARASPPTPSTTCSTRRRCSTRSGDALGAHRRGQPGPAAGARGRRAAARRGRLFNCAVVIHRGRVLGVVPKSYLPEYREYYEKRQFRAARELIGDSVELLGAAVPFGPRPALRRRRRARLRRCTWRSARTCGRRSRPAPTRRWPAPRCWPTCRPATSRSARPTTGAMLCAAQSARMIAAYIYTAAGLGESTTDLAWDGQALIYENGDLLAEAERFADEEQLICADIDLGPDRLRPREHDQLRRLDPRPPRATSPRFRRVEFELGIARAARSRCGAGSSASPTSRPTPRRRNERCEEVYNIQVRGLETRLQATGIEKVVIGVSGGLDSTHALIVVARAMDRLGLPRDERPRLHAARLRHRQPHEGQRLAADGGARRQRRRRSTSARRPSRCSRDIGHPAAEGEKQLRHHLRERAGGRAHLAPVPAGQLPQRARDRHRRPERAGAGLGHLRRGRPHVALLRQRVGAQDAGPVPDPLGDRHRAVRAPTSARCCSRCSTRRSRPS